MATKSETSEIAVLQTQMQTALDGIAAISKKLDNQDSKYVFRTEFQEFKSRWALSHAIVGLICALITGLVVYFLTTRGHIG